MYDVHILLYDIIEIRRRVIYYYMISSLLLTPNRAWRVLSWLIIHWGIGVHDSRLNGAWSAYGACTR